MDPSVTPPPPAVRLAGVVVTLEGLACAAAGLVLLLAGGLSSFGVWGFVLLLGVAVTVAGAALLAGRRGARGPSVVTQLMLLGIAFYAAVPSSRPEWGVPAAVVAVAVLVALLGRSGREWMDAREEPDGESGG